MLILKLFTRAWPSLFSSHYLPHRYCYLADPSLIWANVLMDGLIAVSYVVIFSCLFWIVGKLRHVPDLRPYLWIFAAFGIFILACAATHILEIVTIWWPAYGFSVLVKLICAAASVTTGVLFTIAVPEITNNIRQFLDMLTTGQQQHASDVTEKIRFQGWVRDTETRLRAILDSVADSILTLDASGMIVSVNPAVATMFGYAPQELLGKNISMLVPLANLETKDEAPGSSLPTATSQPTNVGNQLEARTKTGQIIFIELTVTEMSVEGQELYVALIHDITERNQAEQELKKQAALLHLAHDAILVRDLQNRIIFWNDGAQRMYGWAAAEVSSRVSHELLQTRFPCPLASIEKELASKGEWEGELRHTTRDGVEVMVAARWSLQKELGSAKAILEINRDITARTRAEQALHESEQGFQVMVDGIQQLAWIADRQGSIRWYNQRWYEYTGKTLEETDEWKWESVHHPDTLPEVMRQWKEALRTSQPFYMEFPLRGQDGVFRTFLTRVLPLKDAEGQILRWFGTATDISEHKLAEERLEAQAEELYRQGAKVLSAQQALEAQQVVLTLRTTQLEAANAELEAFTYSVSHDLRAPLRQIAGFSRILMEDYGADLPPDVNSTLQRIAAAIRRTGLMVDGLLSLARLGRQSLLLRSIDLNTIVGEILPILEPEYEGRDLEWRIASLPTLECDHILIGQVFQNLLSNAIKYTSLRTRAVIEIDSIQKPGNPAVIFVRDNGIGFHMQYADKLFGVFQRLDAQPQFEGTGVGLATVQRIIHKHGGTVWATASPDQGATFFFTLAAVDPTPLIPSTNEILRTESQV